MKPAAVAALRRLVESIDVYRIQLNRRGEIEAAAQPCAAVPGIESRLRPLRRPWAQRAFDDG